MPSWRNKEWLLALAWEVLLPLGTLSPAIFEAAVAMDNCMVKFPMPLADADAHVLDSHSSVGEAVNMQTEAHEIGVTRQGMLSAPVGDALCMASKPPEAFADKDLRVAMSPKAPPLCEEGLESQSAAEWSGVGWHAHKTCRAGLSPLFSSASVCDPE